jgi:hypothetical protein
LRPPSGRKAWNCWPRQARRGQRAFLRRTNEERCTRAVRFNQWGALLEPHHIRRLGDGGLTILASWARCARVVIQESVLGTADGERRHRPGVLGSSMSAAAASRIRPKPQRSPLERDFRMDALGIDGTEKATQRRSERLSCFTRVTRRRDTAAQCRCPTGLVGSAKTYWETMGRFAMVSGCKCPSNNIFQQTES